MVLKVTLLVCENKTTEHVDILTRYEVAMSTYNFAKEFFEKCRTYRESCDKAKDIEEKKGHLLNEMQSSMACVIFCTICLESYINTYAGDRLPKVVWKKLERLKLEDKWVVVPQLILNKTFKTDREPYKLLKWLTELRNFVVHYKGRFSKPVIDRLGLYHDQVFKKFTLESSEKAFQLVKDVIKTLHSFDCSKTPNWLV